MAINVSEEVQSVKTVEEFDVLVERMKKSHPLKYAARLESGDLAKQRAGLIQSKPEKEKKSGKE